MDGVHSHQCTTHTVTFKLVSSLRIWNGITYMNKWGITKALSLTPCLHEGSSNVITSVPNVNFRPVHIIWGRVSVQNFIELLNNVFKCFAISFKLSGQGHVAVQQEGIEKKVYLCGCEELAQDTWNKWEKLTSGFPKSFLMTWRLIQIDSWWHQVG